MFRLRTFVIYSIAAMLFVTVIAFPASAQFKTRWDKKTTVTINTPVRVGDVLLPAGTYVLRLHDDSSRRLVEIYNADETRFYTMTMGMPDFRNEVTNETVMTFYEADAGRSPALRTWFYQASNFGLEFLDTRGPAQQIASVQEPAPVTESEPVAEAPAPVEEAEPVAEAPAPVEEPTQIAQNEVPPVFEPEPELAPEPEAPAELPKTAGALPLLQLIGLLSLGAAVSLRRFV
jgi:hypothetical protein